MSERNRERERERERERNKLQTDTIKKGDPASDFTDQQRQQQQKVLIKITDIHLLFQFSITPPPPSTTTKNKTTNVSPDYIISVMQQQSDQVRQTDPLINSPEHWITEQLSLGNSLRLRTD